ncbi:amidohydrolase family protein [Sulfuriflexus mobilis]|uniref:amidohydrolase family protein n=1 Tax=Sulfuriflexus mobilis TaxID=1811807 RepID=UPI000F844FAB|nr:amidohydrolase family protein [Sulfuriflexus mobilis]
MKHTLQVCLLLFIGGFPLWLTATELYFVDAHSQVDHEVGDLALILRRMDAAGVDKTILASRGRRPHADIANMAAMYPERIVAAIRTKGGVYRQNNPKFYKKLRRRVNSGNYSAMAEVLIYHAQKGNKAEEVDVPLTDPRVDAVLQACLEKGWPMYLHIEFASLHGDKRRQTMQALERFVDAQPAHPFVLTHMGQLNSDEAGPLLERHNNLYFMVAHTNPVITRQSNQPWTEMFSGDFLKDDWKQLMRQYPERFIFALDNVWQRHWQEFYIPQMAVWRKALAELPDEVAHKFAHGNAERLWRLSPQR